MRYSSSAALLSLFAVLAAASDVLDLTSGSFESTVSGENVMLVEFFAPWCGHCKALAPVYEEAATILKESSIKLAKVDCVAEADLCSKEGVSGYPTLKVFRKGSSSPYTGNRKLDGIVSYMKKQSLPSVTTVTPSNHDEFKESDKVVVLGYFSDSDSTNKAIFNEYAEAHRDDFLFGVSTSEEVASAAGVTLPAVVLYKKFDDGRSDYDFPKSSDTLTADDLEDFVLDNSMPVLDEISPENFVKYSEAGLPLAYVFVESTDENLHSLLKTIEPIAKQYKGRISFAWIDALKFADHAKSLNLVEPKWPAFAIQNIAEGLKYPLSQSLTVDASSVSDFTNRFISGKITPSIKSQPIPKTQDDAVYTVVADSFDEVVYDDSKDVLMEFYATWCGHCKKLAPTYETLAEKYASVSDKLLIAKMDAAENDVPPSAGFQVRGFPTIKFKPAGSKSFIDYDGARDLADFIEFLHKNAVNDITPVEGGSNATGGAPGAEQVVLGGSHDEL